MSLKSILSFSLLYLKALSKQKLLQVVITVRDKYKILDEEHTILQNEYKELHEKYKKLVVAQSKQQLKEVNLQANKPSSKQPEWEMKGVGNDGKGKKKGRGKKGRKGAGNKSKHHSITRTEFAKVEICNICGKYLSQQAPLKSENIRIIEDIPEMPMTLEVIEVRQEKKYCPHCKQVVTARSELALPQTDIGLNSTITIMYLWTSMCMPFTRISTYLNTFFRQKISTAGLSSHIIRVSKIMKPIYEEILEDLKSCGILYADETGWHVDGKNWWLWVFGTSDSAFYTIDKSRGSDVVRRILGEIFTGVLVVDGWRAYQSLICEQQTCMAHLLRKIRELYVAFPKLGSVFKFYVKFRKILRDGERLQSQRTELREDVFNRRLGKLHQRLDELLKWQNPNDILKEIIAKVNRQRPRILTFVEHPDVPCHNNYGEYLIRIGVLKRKVSFGSKSAEGAETYAILLSIHTTCKLRGIPFEDFVKQSLKHYIRTGKPMLLKEYIAQKLNLDKTA
jgi:transposase